MDITALQIEVSAVCNLGCVFCPTTHLKPAGGPKSFSLESYRDLTPYFPSADWVYLQGWGEPFLHPDLWTMIDLARESGAKVGLTTNGTYFTDENLARLFRGGTSGLDLVSVSIAGATPATHNGIRVGSDLEIVLASVRRLIKAKKEHQSALPIVKFSYMLTKQSIAELPEAVAMAAELGVDEFYTTNLDYVFNEWADQNKVFTFREEPDPAHLAYVAAAEKTAWSRNFPFRSYPLKLESPQPVCDLFPEKFIYITANGDVTPCAYLGLPRNPRYFQGEITDVPKKVFGNLREASLRAIWQRDEYVHFRSFFKARKAAHEQIMTNWLYHVAEFAKTAYARRKYEAALEKTPVPPECAGCYKMYGA